MVEYYHLLNFTFLVNRSYTGFVNSAYKQNDTSSSVDCASKGQRENFTSKSRRELAGTKSRWRIGG